MKGDAKVKVELLKVLLGIEIPVANHPLFSKVWDKYSSSYNRFVEESHLSEKQLVELNILLDHTRAVERLGYLMAYKVGTKSTTLEQELCELSEGILSLDKRKQIKVIEYVHQLKREGENEFK